MTETEIKESLVKERDIHYIFAMPRPESRFANDKEDYELLIRGALCTTY